MPEFVYRAARADGKILKGRIAAETRENAFRRLRGEKLTPIDIMVVGQAEIEASSSSVSAQSVPVRSWRLPFAHRQHAPGFREVLAFTSELAVMLRAGLSLDRALRILISMSHQPAMERLLQDLFDAVKGGQSLSQALSPHQGLFGDFYINMVRSGEASGQLAEVLTRLAEHLERLKSLRESVMSALIYPAILVVVAVLSVALMLGYVVPQFESLFDDMGEALPLPTRVIVGAGHMFSQWGWALVILAVVLGWLARFWVRTRRGRLWWHQRVLVLPVLGGILRKYEITRFARSMGTLLGNGVAIVTAIRIASETMGNESLRSAVAGIGPSVKQGGRLGDALEQSGLFTPLTLSMVRLGEETGRLDEMLLEVARVHDDEVESGIKRAMTLVEPVLILTLGAVIALIIISILMGILSVNELAI